MKRSLLMVAIVVGIIGAWSIGRLQGQAPGDKVIFVSSSKANYTAMQPGNPAVTAAAVWGDATAGAHGTFSKFAPGYEAGEKRIGPGDFLRVPGGHKHWSGGDKKEGAIFYEESSGKFDLIPAK
jgi:hypothetical protein